MFKLICYETCYDSQCVIEYMLTNSLEICYVPTLSVRTVLIILLYSALLSLHLTYLSFMSHAENEIELITAKDLLRCGLLCEVQKTACVQIFFKNEQLFWILNKIIEYRLSY